MVRCFAILIGCSASPLVWSDHLFDRIRRHETKFSANASLHGRETASGALSAVAMNDENKGR